MSLNLAHERGREVMRRLIKDADVFLTSVRPFQLERFQMGYEPLSELNPRLIYASVLGYGRKGADKDKPSTETTAFHARSGMLHISKEPGAHPITPPLASGDSVAGMSLTMGIMMALYVREKTGVGQQVDVSLFHAGIYTVSNDVSGSLATGKDRPVVPRYEAKQAPGNFFRTKDDRWARCVIQDRYYPAFCRALGREDLITDPRFAEPKDRQENHAALFDILEESPGKGQRYICLL
jgi:crotonobetainyl-CoA:carnitine CoA-transferase CaiB-like acyl-CoA transferase